MKATLRTNKQSGTQHEFRTDALDEVLVTRGKNVWLHLEQMSEKKWWMGLGNAESGTDYAMRLWIEFDKRGKAKVTVE